MRGLPFSVWVGWRFVRRQANEGGGFVSFVALMAMLGMMIGVAALIVVLSVMNGFQEELRERILRVTWHVEVTAEGGVLEEWEELRQRLERRAGVEEVAPFAMAQGLMRAGDQTVGVMVRGVEIGSEGRWKGLVQVGDLQRLREGSFTVAVGSDLARRLGVGVGDPVAIVVPDQGGGGPLGWQPRLRLFRVGAIFESGMYEVDAGVALVALGDAQALLRLGKGVHGIGVQLSDPLSAPAVVRAWVSDLPRGLWLSDWTSQHANLFRAVQLEKTMMTLVLFLIVAVAAFNLVATLVMSVQIRRGGIAILRTLGATRATVVTIFVVEGATIGLVGLIAGSAAGVWLAFHVPETVAFLEWATGLVLWSKEVYLLNEIPSRVVWSDVGGVVGAAAGLTLLATVYPSWRAAGVLPAQALRDG
ncbi:MAG: lipoprotein-releasing ABC transporter permease subunit [Hydrogenophilus sp.]|nr:lipoprotein-releasing ABC transporter permease subunit [Hydrogenophilus sp.]